jgi:CheY-like chemotaxis protein
MREEPYPSLIIAVTASGLASETNWREAILCGMDVFLTKPVSFKEVGKIIDTWITSHGSTK